MGERYNRYGRRLLLQVDDSTVCSVPPQWTDRAAPDAEIVMGEGRGLLRVPDFMELARLVVRLGRTLHNPRYAGAYAYGRRRYRRAADGKKVQQARDCNDWLACIPNAHPGYVTWDRFQENLKLLETNGRAYELARALPPREGAALLQGRAVCGRCGQHMRVRYAARRGGLEAWYVCDRAQSIAPNCQSVAGGPIDEAIGALVVEEMTPAAVELALEIRAEIESRQDEADQLRCRAIERAQADADLAQRRFMLVDPNNRLVADTLESEWNDKLRTLVRVREDRERGRQDDERLLGDAVREKLVAMTSDFRQLWADPGTPNRERKRMLDYSTGMRRSPIHGLARCLPRPQLRPALALRSTSRSGHADQVRGGSAPGHPREHARALGDARAHLETRLQRPRLPVRGAKVDPANQALQSMGSTRRSETGQQEREGINALASVEKRCSMKIVGGPVDADYHMADANFSGCLYGSSWLAQ